MAKACNVSEIKNREKRAPNFTDQENRLLVNLVLLHDEVENKKTDAITWKIKETTWAMIADKFNANSGTIYRAAGNLRKKYEQMKKILRKKVTKNKQETFKTGGGNPDYIKIEDWEKDLLLIIEKQINGLPSEFDSDSILPKTDITGAELIVDATTVTNNYPLELVIDTEKPSTSNTVPISIHFSDMEVECPSPVSDWQTCNSLEMNVVKECTKNATDIGNNLNRPEVKSKTQDNWSSWTPKQLKSRKNPLLTRSSLKNEPIKNILNKKVDSVLDSREELVKLQIDCLREEHEIKIKQHKLEMKIMHEKRMQLLEIKIANSQCMCKKN